MTICNGAVSFTPEFVHSSRLRSMLLRRGEGWFQECDWLTSIPVKGSKNTIAWVGCWLPVSFCWVSASNHQLGFLLREPSHLGAGLSVAAPGSCQSVGTLPVICSTHFNKHELNNFSSHAPAHPSVPSHPKLEFQIGRKASFCSVSFWPRKTIYDTDNL